MSESAADRAKRLVADTCVPRAGHREGYETKWGNHCLDCIAAEIAAAEQAARDEAERECIKVMCGRCAANRPVQHDPTGSYGIARWIHILGDGSIVPCGGSEIRSHRRQRAADEGASDEQAE